MDSVNHETPSSNKEREILEKRINLATQFLNEVLIAKLADSELDSNPPLTPERVFKLYDDFRQEHPGLGDDFDLLHCWHIAWQKYLLYQVIAEAEPWNLPKDAGNVIRIRFLLEGMVFEELNN